jgi:hypothetical protein
MQGWGSGVRRLDNVVFNVCYFLVISVPTNITSQPSVFSVVIYVAFAVLLTPIIRHTIVILGMLLRMKCNYCNDNAYDKIRSDQMGMTVCGA